MREHLLVHETALQTSPDEAWAFFSDPNNLPVITPPELGLEIRSGNLPQAIYDGLQIAYTVRPLLNIAVPWVSEIRDVVSMYRFTDVQIRGPYAKWVHSHIFERQGDGVLMTDKVVYALPGGTVGDFLLHPLVRKRLERIFHYREDVIADVFQITV